MIDFLVIGGGIAGISVAARLSDLGHVTVLEAESGLGYHASGRSAAVFEQTYGEPSTIVLNRASHDFHATANGGVLSPRGMMLIGSAHDRTEFMAGLKTMAMEHGRTKWPRWRGLRRLVLCPSAVPWRASRHPAGMMSAPGQ